MNSLPQEVVDFLIIDHSSLYCGFTFAFFKGSYGRACKTTSEHDKALSESIVLIVTLFTPLKGLNVHLKIGFSLCFRVKIPICRIFFENNVRTSDRRGVRE